MLDDLLGERILTIKHAYKKGGMVTHGQSLLNIMATCLGKSAVFTTYYMFTSVYCVCYM